MPQQPVPDVCRVVINWSTLNQTWSNTFHAKLAGFGNAEQVALADAVNDAVVASILPALSTQVHFDDVTVYDLNTNLSPIVVDADGAAAGPNVVEIAPIVVAAVVTNYTGARGRSGRGRTYWTGLDEAAWQNGELTAGAQTAVLGWHNAVITAIELVNFDFVLVSRYQNHVELPVPQTYPVGSWAIRSARPGTQRRRVDRP